MSVFCFYAKFAHINVRTSSFKKSFSSSYFLRLFKYVCETIFFFKYYFSKQKKVLNIWILLLILFSDFKQSYWMLSFNSICGILNFNVRIWYQRHSRLNLRQNLKNFIIRNVMGVKQNKSHIDHRIILIFKKITYSTF